MSVKTSVKDNSLIITIPVNGNGEPSKSGKSILFGVVTTKKGQEIKVNGHNLRVNLQVYELKPKAERDVIKYARKLEEAQSQLQA